jgi:glycosyltransferase involved in cell wall biosynthesis
MLLRRSSVRYYLSFVKLKFSYPSTANINILILKYCQLFLKPFRQRHIIRIRLANTLKVVSLTENVGVGAAKNIGIEMCSCELIAVMDTDDVSLPKRFEKQLAVFENQDVDTSLSILQ